MASNHRERNRAVYVISVAAELAGVHPQTLRIYERKGLVDPARTAGGSRRYSDADISQLRRIQELTTEGLNLAGVQKVLELEAQLAAVEAELADVKAQADAKQLKIHLGTWSIDPTSKAFRPKWGTAEEHLALGIRSARALGSPVLRVVLGTWEDRLTDGGIARHIDEVVRVCRSQRSRATDAGVKIAIENHAGDMHSTELVQLVEAAGKDFVGVNLDKQPSWAAVARAMGAEGQRIEKLSDVGPALRAAAAAQRDGKTTVLEMMVTRELGDPFRRDALALPTRHLAKYRSTAAK